MKSYFALIIGAILAALLVAQLDQSLIPGSSSYFSSGALISYWTTITTTSLLVSLSAAISGGFILMTNKSVLTAGVMIALALIPRAALGGMALVEGDFSMAGKAFFRLLLEILIVAVFSGLVFLLKRFSTQKRRMRA